MAAAIRREVSELLHTGLRDERVQQGLVSVTGVEVAGDLQHCKIFVSVYGSDDDRSQALEGLRAATPYVKGELGRRLRMRRTPEVVFQLDRGLERGMTVLGVLHRLEQERLQREEESGREEPPEADSSGDASAQRDAP
jgi:ribosome-binding factor A